MKHPIPYIIGFLSAYLTIVIGVATGNITSISQLAQPPATANVEAIYALHPCAPSEQNMSSGEGLCANQPPTPCNGIVIDMDVCEQYLSSIPTSTDTLDSVHCEDDKCYPATLKIVPQVTQWSCPKSDIWLEAPANSTYTLLVDLGATPNADCTQL